MPKSSGNKKNQFSNPSLTYWNGAFGGLLCLFAFLFPFFPDEKLVRLKLQFFEVGVFALLFFIGLRGFLANQWMGLTSSLSEKESWLNKAHLISVVFWLLMAVFLWFLSTEQSLATDELRRIILALATFAIFRFGGVSVKWQHRFLISWSFSASLLALYGVMQRFGGLGIFVVPQMDRVFGTFGNPIFFAAFLLVSLFLTLAAIQSIHKKIFLSSYLLRFGFALQLVALFYTQTRAAWIALGVSLFLWGVVHFGLKKVPLWIWGIIFIGLFLFGIKTQDIWKRDQGHLMIWRDTIQMWAENPIQGKGLGSFHAYFPDYAKDDLKAKWPQGKVIVNYSHNEFLQLAAEGGVLLLGGFFLTLFFYFSCLKGVVRNDLNSSRSSPAFWVALGSVALLVQNFFSVDMRFSISFAIFFGLMGLVLTMALGPKEDKDSYLETPIPFPLRIWGAFAWVSFMFLVCFPLLWQPYKARQEFSQKVDFFDERLLDPTKSIDDLLALLEQYPDEPAVLERLAFVYAKEMKTVDGKINQSMADKSIATYRRLIEVDPNRLAGHNNFGNVLYTLGKVNEAIEQWEKAIELKPDFKDGRLNLGKVYYVQGKLRLSTEQFEEVLKLDPNNSDALIYLKKMVE